MMNKLKNWFVGTLSIQLSGLGKDRLLNLCKKNDIQIHKLLQEDEYYRFTVTTGDYNKLKRYNEKIKTDINVIDKNGLPHFLYKYKKRKIFLLSFLLFLCFLLMFSNYVWNISVYGNSIYTDVEIIQDVKENYVKLGTPKSKINCSDLEKRLREKYDKVAWISCELKGTNLIINIEETLSSQPNIKSNHSCNIIAYKDAIITDVVINNGERLVSSGDEVKKNDILITGVVNIYNEYDELIETNYTSASGTVYGIVEYDYYDEFSLQTNKKQYTGKTKKSYYIEIFNNILKLPSKDIKYKNYDIVTENHRIKIFDDFYMPISVSKNEYNEYTTKPVTLSNEQAKKQAMTKLNSYIDKLKKKGVSIIENNVTIDIVDGKCVASGRIKCKEIVGIPAPIDNTSVINDSIEHN